MGLECSTPRTAHTIGREFPALRKLSLRRFWYKMDGHFSMPPPPGMSDRKLNALGQLRKLRFLSLNEQCLTRLPRSLVQRMRDVESLSISGNNGLKQLPSRLGEWMPGLHVVMIADVRLEVAPRSVLHTTQQNYDDFDGLDHGFMISRDAPMDVWKLEFSTGPYRSAAQRLGRYKNGRPWWVGTLVKR